MRQTLEKGVTKILSIVLMLIFMLPFIFPTISIANDDDWVSNGIMRFRKNGSDGLSIQGRVHGEWQQTTWSDRRV